MTELESSTVCACVLTLLTRAVSGSLSCVPFFAAPRAAGHHASLSLGFSRQEYWGGLPFSSPGDLPNPGIEPVSPALTGVLFTSLPLGKPSQ